MRFLARALCVPLLVPIGVLGNPSMDGLRDEVSSPRESLVTPAGNSSEEKVTKKATKWDIPKRLRLPQTDEKRSRRYQQAPCFPCLDEWEAMDVAKTYLDTYPISYIGIRAEIAKGFPWRGKAIRWSRDDSEWYFGYRIGLNLEAENPDYVAEHPEENDHTWRIWFQTGWIETDEIAQAVAKGNLPEEALNWGRQPKEEFVLVHAKTGAVKPVRFGRYEAYYRPRRDSPLWWKFKKTVKAAEARAKKWLPDSAEESL